MGKKNILFIILDQLRADCVFGELGDCVALPNIRALAADAVRFDRHYSVTTPCGPSRASILTGQYAMNHRAIRNGTPLGEATPTLPGELRKGGWRPLLFGYTDTGQDPRALPPGDPALTSYEEPMRGFEVVCEMQLERSIPWRGHLLARGYDVADYGKVFRPDAPEGRPPRLDDPALYAAEDSDTAFLTDRFLAHMRALKQESWCAHLTYIRPHPPLVAPAPYNRLVDPATLPAPATSRVDHPFMGAARAHFPLRRMVDGFDGLSATPETVSQLRATYLGLAAEVDAHLGRVLAWLKETGQYDDTLILLTADHGEMLGDFGLWGKMSVFEAAFRTPLLLRVPGNAARAGSTVEAFTESVDLAPTILDWAGLAPPNAMDGRSLLPLAAGHVPQGWRQHSMSELDLAEPLAPTVFQSYLGLAPTEAGVAILREPRYTLVEFAGDVPPLLLDHLGAGEALDVAGDPAHAAELARLTRTLLRHRMRHADQTLALTTITGEGARTVRRHGGCGGAQPGQGRE